MPIVTLPINPDATLSEVPKVRRSQYEQGILHLKEDGINSIPQSWSLVFGGLDRPKLKQLLDILRTAKGVDPIEWKSPLDTAPRYWNVMEWTTTCLNGKIFEVSTTFNEWFGYRFIPPPTPVDPSTHNGQVIITVRHNGSYYEDPNLSNLIYSPHYSEHGGGFKSPTDFIVQGPVTRVNWFYSREKFVVPAYDSADRYTTFPVVSQGGYQLNVEWFAKGKRQAYRGPHSVLRLSQGTRDGSVTISDTVPGATFSYKLL